MYSQSLCCHLGGTREISRGLSKYTVAFHSHFSASSHCALEVNQYGATNIQESGSVDGEYMLTFFEVNFQGQNFGLLTLNLHATF